MSLTNRINEELKAAMKAKDQASLRALRAIKSALLILNTQEGGKEVTPEDEMAALIKMAKQRKDSISIYEEQSRDDLAQVEKEELAVIERFLPQQLTEEEIANEVDQIIQQIGASSMADMGKVMGMASGKLKGKADGKVIAQIVRSKLT